MDGSATSDIAPGGAAAAAHGSAPGRRPDLPRLTVARGVGAVVIVLGHCTLTNSLPTERLNDFAIDLMQVLGVAGVSCFFTLSGFVLTWATPRGDAARAVWRRRFWRLYPIHAIMWLAGLAVFIACGVEFRFGELLPSLALLQIWVPDLDVFWGTNTPSWTLAAEAFFYALFPLLVVAAWRLPERRLYRAVGLIVAAMALWALAVAVVLPSTPDIDDGTPLSRAQYFGIVSFAPARLLDFTLGILLARIVIAGRVPAGLRPWAYGSVVAGYVVARWVVPQPLGFVAVMAPAVIIGLLYSASADLAGRPTRWHAPLWLWLGNISYPLYLVHWPVIFGAHRALGEPVWSVPQALLFAVGALLVSIAIAHVLHRTVEVPLYRRYGRRRRRAQANAQPAIATAD